MSASLSRGCRRFSYVAVVGALSFLQQFSIGCSGGGREGEAPAEPGAKKGSAGATPSRNEQAGTALGVALTGEAADGEKPDRGRKTPAQMVEDLANRNNPPKLVEIYSDRLPLFPRDYDWDEQHRVQKALTELSKDTSEELWEELVRRSDDARYCLTYMDEGDWGWNRSVGFFCSAHAGAVLRDVALRHLPRQWMTGKRTPALSSQGRWNPGLPRGMAMIADIIDIKTGLREWREKRKGKALYQLQLELCERALDKVRDAEDVPEGEREAARKAIEAEAAKLRQTKRPAEVEVHPGVRVWDICTREYAEHCRKQIELKE
jgi:hypothetical protein